MVDKSCEAMNVRFFINTKTRRIIYAEAGKEFVDFLFSFLSMPIGSVLKLVHESESNRRKNGSLSNLYDSMEKLPSQFMSTDKSQLLDPKFITTYSNKSLKIEGGKYYTCSYPDTTHSSSVFGSGLNFSATSSPFTGFSPFTTSSPTFATSSPFGGVPRENITPTPIKTEVTVVRTSTIHNMSTSNKDICVCGNPINRPLQLLQKRYISSGSSSQNAGQGQSGYVKEIAMFIITDDLKITGSSTSVIMTLLNQLNIKDLTELEERTTIVDRNKALKLLEASLVSTTVLSDVFAAEFSVPAEVSSS
ncbi:hypothetical protein SUGI_0132110 [Cryptomeria japonica]|uniref:uncharacterized protein LOC131034542 n=1 Tax=Cryptomeria japonica TaxID=3369 RepID=UPI002408997A|nr:uncharacterized protein LOC131034542 [Cryptomeria japonica]GLJ10631.1 hypothetical protein SUGI_0132110 [Cryptomeria japonica]